MSGKGGMKLNLLLASVLIAVSMFAYWFEFRKKGELERAKESATRVFSFDQNRDLESVKIVSKEKGLNLEFRCKENCKMSSPNAFWEITSPIAFRADEGNLGTFVSTLASLNTLETIKFEGVDPEAQLKSFNLSKDSREDRKVELKFKGDSNPYAIYVGDSAAVGENVYVYATGPGIKSDGIHIVANYFKTNMDRNLTYWRAKRLFTFGASEVEGVTLTNVAGKVELRKKDGSWVLGADALADNEAVDAFITGLAFLNAQDYASDNKKKDIVRLGLGGKPKYEVAIRLKKGDEVRMSVWDFLGKDKQPKMHAILSDKNYIAELERSNGEKFGKKAEAFRFRNLITPAERQKTAKVSVRLEGKDSHEFEASKVELAITKAAAARIADFLWIKAVPSGNSELSAWTFLDKDGKTLRSFTIYGSGEKGEFYVKLSSGEFAKLERGSGSEIPSKLTQFETPAKK